MNVSGVYIDEVLIALFAVALSAASLVLTFRDNKRMSAATEHMANDNARMAAANEQMAATNAGMLAENRRMSDANEQMVELTRRMQEASERAAQIAEEEAQRQARERTEANKARFAFRDGRRQGDGYQAHLVNRALTVRRTLARESCGMVGRSGEAKTKTESTRTMIYNLDSG